MLKGGAGYSQVHAATAGDPPYQRRTWRKANPGLDWLPDLEKIIRREADKARKDPTAGVRAFKALRLNMGVSDVTESVLIDADTWLKAEVEGPVHCDGPYVLGLDLGTSAAMSAAAAYWPGYRRP